MTTIFLGAKQGLVAVTKSDGQWKADLALDAAQVPAVAFDPDRPELIYAGTFQAGVFRSQDGGRTWTPCGPGIEQPLVWSIAVSPNERNRGRGVVYAGTEMSALYRSEDGGDSWHELQAVQDIPSKPTWSFPPKPDTHHVRCILCDPNQEGLVLLGIEQGGVMRSEDGGKTWADHNPQAQIDPHTIRAHPDLPGHIYESAGGGYAESNDFGRSWLSADGGMEHHYCYGLAVDPADPLTVVISAAPDYIKAHNPRDSWATIYRRTDGSSWQQVTAGLPGPQGVQTQLLGSNPAEPHTFYMSTTGGDVYRSGDKGANWDRLAIEWAELKVDGVRTVVPSPE